MTASRSEVFVLVYAGMLAIIAAIAWYGARLTAFVATVSNPDVAVVAGRAIHAINLSAIAAVFAAILAVFWLYPVIRNATHERGSLTRKNRSYLAAALTDPLTGLQNRRYFDDAVREYMKAFGPVDLQLGVVLVDIDHFKAINDTHGHDNGDLVLHAVGHCLRQHTRYHDVTARVGGEEFGILFADVDARVLVMLADRIRNAVESMVIELDGQIVEVTASLGVAMWDGSEDSRKLIKRADQLLYKAKTGGRNRVMSDMPVNDADADKGLSEAA